MLGVREKKDLDLISFEFEFNKKLSSISSVVTELSVILRQNRVLMDIKEEKEELVEMFGVYFESLYHLPPLASRILSNLIIDGYKSGLTFETLVAKLGASKSSVSTNLNFLLKTGKISYYTLAGDRKKYFKAAPLSERMSNYLKMLDFEKEIIEKLMAYREKTIISPEEHIQLDNIRAYKLHILEMEELLLKTINQFKAIEKNK